MNLLFAEYTNIDHLHTIRIMLDTFISSLVAAGVSTLGHKKLTSHPFMAMSFTAILVTNTKQLITS